MFDAELKKMHITFTYSMDIEHEYVYLDEIKDREIFTNLTSNTLK